jgi:hypothetical protein
MYKKLIVMVVMVVAIILPMGVKAYELTVTEQLSEIEFAREYEREIELVQLHEKEIARLYELAEHLNSTKDSSREILSSAGMPAEMPQIISAITSPLTFRYFGHILIGVELDVDISHLCPDKDHEEILKLTTREVPDEIVEFILSFTGFPRDIVKIGYATIILQQHGDPQLAAELADSSNEMSAKNSIVPLNQQFSMGQIINVPSLGITGATVGHPRPGGRSFMTALHRIVPTGTDVFSFNTRIGSVTRSIYTEAVDVTEVSLVSTLTMSTNLPLSHGGQPIANFRGVPQNGDFSISIRGFSGVQDVRVFQANTALDGYRGMMLVSPDARSQAGDSGAALIRTSDRAVLGTRKGTLQHLGQIFGLYSSVQRY